MKKIIVSLIIFVMLLTTISFAETKAKVNVDAIRIRESASTDSKIITNVYLDDIVEILEENGEWSKIKYGDNVGYTKTQFLTKVNSTTDKNNSTSEAKNEIKSDYTETNTVVDEKQILESNDQTNQTMENSAVENSVVENKNIEQPMAVTEPLANQDVNIGENVILKNNLKIRRIPSFSNKEYVEIAEGTNVLIVNVLENWTKISNGTSVGWVLKNKLFALNLVETPSISTDIPEAIDTTTTPNLETVENTVSANTTIENTLSQNTINNDTENTLSDNSTVLNNSETKKGVVIVETARVRQTASTKGEIIGTLDEDEVVTILGEEGEFYKITSKSINSGYVSKKLIKEKNVTSRSLSTERADDTVSDEVNEQLSQILNQANEESEELQEVETVSEVANSSKRNEVIEFAKQYLGYAYVSGGHSPETGFDCSGFTRYIFGHFGYTLGATAASQTSLGVEVAREDLQTADLILYYDEGMTKIGHVGIYLGDGNFIHSANPKRGVVIDNLNTNSYYSKRFVTARRIVE